MTESVCDKYCFMYLPFSFFTREKWILNTKTYMGENNNMVEKRFYLQILYYKIYLLI